MDRLTARQQQIFDLIRDNLEDTGYPPTRAEIAQQLGLKFYKSVVVRSDLQQ